MRLHRLSLTAFGPFGGTHRIDFDGLSAAGLFLLHGPTGAGKTSVLDAVCFALYGTVPGARQQPGGTLRSDHADPHTLTEVLLELTVGGRRLEITRRPEQSRPKRRGTGRTTEKAQSWLREHDAATGEWRGLSRSHQEIGEELKQLTGMSREQFCQVVLLPQGDFARFLRASGDDRGKLLSDLFDTGRFTGVEAHLGRLRKDAQDRVRAGDESLLALAHRMGQAAGDGIGPERLPATAESAAARPAVPDQRRTPAGKKRSAAGTRTGDVPEPAAGDPGLAAAVLGWAALARTDARERRDIAASAARLAEARHAEAAEHLEDVRRLARRRRRHDGARRRADALEACADERAEAARRLERARAAEAVVPAARMRETAHAGHLDAAEHESRLRAQLPPDLVDATPLRLTERERAVRQELGTLESARRAEMRSEDITRELGALGGESRADEEVLRDAGEWLESWDAARRTHQQRVDSAHEAATRAETLAGRLTPLRHRLDAARRRDRLESDAGAVEKTLLGAREKSASAQEHWLDLKDRRLRGIAAELAENLQDGTPCPVCGAAEHPAPARAGEGHVDRGAEDTALAAYRQADAARESAEKNAAAFREELAAARAESGDDGVDALADGVAGLEAEHAAARTGAADAHAAREALDRAEREHDRRVRQHQEAERRSAARTSRRDALQREQAALTGELHRVTDGETGVARRAALLEHRAALLADAAEAARTAESAARHLREAEEQLADATAQARFDTPEAAVEAVLDATKQLALRRHLEAWQAEEAAVEAELQDPETAAAAALPVPDEDAAGHAADAATHQLRAASAADEAARKRCADLDGLTARAVADVQRLAPLRDACERVSRLAGLVAGTSADNERKMRLESYVLAARLEQVAAAASARLATMTSHRYTLVHSDERGGRGRSGLGLHVIDAWTGAERDTGTLSGGETFAASLALALGLADVVTEEAGGTRLETLFIDEGFGSLDEQTLDEVLDVLDSLRERDRCVGIVSHVADLRRRIPAQLEVVKTRTGSALRHRSAPAAG